MQMVAGSSGSGIPIKATIKQQSPCPLSVCVISRARSWQWCHLGHTEGQKCNWSLTCVV
jgi:hypothetical protein